MEQAEQEQAVAQPPREIRNHQESSTFSSTSFLNPSIRFRAFGLDARAMGGLGAGGLTGGARFGACAESDRQSVFEMGFCSTHGFIPTVAVSEL